MVDVKIEVLWEVSASNSLIGEMHVSPTACRKRRDGLRKNVSSLRLRHSLLWKFAEDELLSKMTYGTESILLIASLDQSNCIKK